MNKFMELAIKEAYVGIQKKHGGPFGAVIVKGNKVIAKAHNTVLKDKDATCHGEMNAIRKACKKLKTNSLEGCDIYTTGEPCPMCLNAIRWANISKVYYGCSVEDTDKIGFRDKKFENLKRDNKQLVQMHSDECQNLYDDYRKKKHKLY